ncbi:MAG: histidine phosphatase family protein [Chromatiales bacterium]|nr:histidine phosphatase family protein [Chromatiales bacterium]
MQRRLTLLRHAKSSWKDASLADFERPLNARGERDAPLIACRLLAQGARPSLILTSPAVRARRTAQIIARELGYPAEFLQTEDELYLAEAGTIVDVISRQDDKFRDLMLVGHNPGLTELANRIMGPGSLDNLPTCGVLVFDLALAHWKDLEGIQAIPSWHDYPRRIPG